MRRIAIITAIVAFVAATASADVRTEEKSQVTFEGGIGRVMNLFGGRAAKEGIVTSVAVKGDRKMSTTDRTAQLIDLREEKIYELDLAKKTYTVMTFAEMRRRIEDARRKAAEQQTRQQPTSADPNAPQYQADFDLKDGGQKKTINGFDAHEVVMTITVHEKGKALDQSGGMVLTANTWLAPKVPAMKDLIDFERRFAEKLGLPTLVDAQQMATAMGMYPMLADGMKRMQAENVRLDGTAVLTQTRVEIAAPPGSAQESSAKPSAKDEPAPRSLGGLGGALARRALRNKDKEKDADASAPTTPGRAGLMSMQHEVLKVTPAVTDADVAIPSGFKEKS